MRPAENVCTDCDVVWGDGSLACWLCGKTVPARIVEAPQCRDLGLVRV